MGRGRRNKSKQKQLHQKQKQDDQKSYYGNKEGKKNHDSNNGDKFVETITRTGNFKME